MDQHYFCGSDMFFYSIFYIIFFSPTSNESVYHFIFVSTIYFHFLENVKRYDLPSSSLLLLFDVYYWILDWTFVVYGNTFLTSNFLLSNIVRKACDIKRSYMKESFIQTQKVERERSDSCVSKRERDRIKPKLYRQNM